MKRALKKYVDLPGYVFFPTALLHAKLSPTEVYVYALLLDRAVAAERGAPEEETAEEETFICFPARELAETLGRSEGHVKQALRGLEKRALITRRRQGGGRPDRIWIN